MLVTGRHLHGSDTSLCKQEAGNTQDPVPCVVAKEFVASSGAGVVEGVV